MKKTVSIILMAFVALTTATSAIANTGRGNMQLGEVLIDVRPCLFFYLANVNEADPAVPGQKWFAIPVTASNYQTYASIIISARLSRQSVGISTDGSVSCGYATATLVSLSA